MEAFSKARKYLINCSAYIRRKSMYNAVARKFKNTINKDILTKEQKFEIDKFYKKNYGKKISYKWHNLFTMRSGVFDVKYIPFDIFLKFTDIMNSKEEYCEILKDKNFLYMCANLAGVKTPKRYFYSINNNLFDSDNNIISKEEFYEKITNIGEVFIKPTRFKDTGYARNCKIINMVNGIDTYSNTSLKDIINKNYTSDFIVQEKIVCHKTISDIYSKSVNTFSISSLIWDDKIKTPKYMLKLGRANNFVDWNGSKNGNLLIRIKEDGTLHDFAFSPGERKKYYTHPDTGFVFKNHKIDLFPKILDTAKKLHSVIPWVNFCNWDITFDYVGNPVVIEMEKPVGMSISSQLSLGESYFGEDTAEILSFIKNH